MSYIDTVDANDVVDIDSLIQYIRQTFGTPTFIKDVIAFRRSYKLFVTQNPLVTIPLVVRAIDWAATKQKKPRRRDTVLHYVGDAYAAGLLPELDPRRAAGQQIDRQIQEALQVETDDTWRFRLIVAEGKARADVLNAWRAQHPAVAS